MMDAGPVNGASGPEARGLPTTYTFHRDLRQDGLRSAFIRMATANPASPMLYASTSPKKTERRSTGGIRGLGCARLALRLRRAICRIGAATYDRPLSPSTIKIQAPRPDASLCVGILVGDASTGPSLELEEQGRVEGYLARLSGGVVAVCSFVIPEAPNWIAEGREILQHPESAWYAGPPLSDEVQFAWGFTGEGEELRAAYEIAVDEPPSWTVPGALSGFNGQVRPWAEVPVAVPSGIDPCALLLMPIGETHPQLFLHEHARCVHSELQRTANELVQAHDSGQLDEGWMRLPDGRYFTLIMTRRGGASPTSRLRITPNASQVSEQMREIAPRICLDGAYQ